MFGSVLLYEAATASEPPASLPLQDSSMAVLHHPPLCANRLSVHWLWQAAACVCRPLWAAMLHHLAAVAAGPGAVGAADRRREGAPWRAAAGAATAGGTLWRLHAGSGSVWQDMPEA